LFICYINLKGNGVSLLISQILRLEKNLYHSECENMVAESNFWYICPIFLKHLNLVRQTCRHKDKLNKFSLFLLTQNMFESWKKNSIIIYNLFHAHEIFVSKNCFLVDSMKLEIMFLFCLYSAICSRNILIFTNFTLYILKMF
jgi:hypothetical protein